MNPEQLFKQLFQAGTEQELAEIIISKPEVFKDENWHPLGHYQSSFSMFKNQKKSWRK